MTDTDQVVSRRELRDLAVLLALPKMWVDQEPASIVAGLMDVLFGMLRLDVGYVCFGDPASRSALECWRPDGPEVPVELQPMLAVAPTREHGAVMMSVATPAGAGSIRVVSTAPAFPGEYGVVIVGSTRADFPTEFELHLLRATIGQATISIHTARLLAGERAARVAAEAALQQRNEFLARLADDLLVPLTALEEHVARAHDLATTLSAPASLEDPASGAASHPPLASAPQDGVPPLVSPVRLTRRESEVLGLLAQGLSNREIAGILWLSERTIERHITGLYRKIGVERRTEATAFALRHGLVDASAPDA